MSNIETNVRALSQQFKSPEDLKRFVSAVDSKVAGVFDKSVIQTSQQLAKSLHLGSVGRIIYGFVAQFPSSSIAA
jgi:hypothetical protein